VNGENANKVVTFTSSDQNEVFTNASLVTKTNSINTLINIASSKSLTPFVQLPSTQSSANYNNTVINDHSSTYIDANETVAKFTAANTISFLKNNQLTNFKFNSKDYNKYLNDLKLSILCPGSNPNTDWYIEPFAGAIYGFKKITNNTATNTYLQQKDSSERMRIGYAAGVNLGNNGRKQYMMGLVADASARKQASDRMKLEQQLTDAGVISAMRQKGVVLPDVSKLNSKAIEYNNLDDNSKKYLAARGIRSAADYVNNYVNTIQG
jgi:hypothetical protein